MANEKQKLVKEIAGDGELPEDHPAVRAQKALEEAME